MKHPANAAETRTAETASRTLIILWPLGAWRPAYALIRGSQTLFRDSIVSLARSTALFNPNLLEQVAIGIGRGPEY